LSNYHYCGTKIYWHRVNGKPKIFEDKDGTIRHVCNPLPDKNIDHILLASTITRVSELETSLEQLKNEFVNYKQRQNNFEG